jgi:type III secretory pathway component EscR
MDDSITSVVEMTFSEPKKLFIVVTLGGWNKIPFFARM